MKRYGSLTRRFVLFIALVIGVLAVGSLTITSTSVRLGLSNLFQQRLNHTATVLDQYLRARYVSKLSEIETVLSSPRLLAAVETADSSTIAAEAPVYRESMNAAMFMVIDRSGQVVFDDAVDDTMLVKQALESHAHRGGLPHIGYINTDRDIYEVYYNSLSTPDGLELGEVVICDNTSSSLVRDLNQLTGFDVVVSTESKILGHSESRFVQAFLMDHGATGLADLPQGKVTEASVGDEDILFLSLRSEMSNATITFLASLDEHITPIMQQESLFLILLALGGGLLATGVVFAYTRRNLGRQVRNLVSAAERVAGGDLDFAIESTNRDELGYLAGEFEHMRAELLRARQERERAHQERIKSERLATIGQLATGIIHDFKNPMAVIHGTVDLIQTRGGERETLTRYCGTITDQINRMVELTRDLLEYARGESRLEIQTVRLMDYFADVISFHAPAFQRSGLRLGIDDAADISVTIDPGRFRRVFDNLLSNAGEALKPGDRVMIGWRLTPDELIVSVTDNGPGIPQEILAELFHPFVTHGKSHGTGLGLAIAQKVVEDHGGTIEAESEPGGGAVFLVRLPIKMVLDEAPVEMRQA